MWKLTLAIKKRLKDQKGVEDDFIILRIKENSIGIIKETREDD